MWLETVEKEVKRGGVESGEVANHVPQRDNVMFAFEEMRFVQVYTLATNLAVCCLEMFVVLRSLTLGK